MSSIRFAIEDKGHKGGPGRTFLTRNYPQQAHKKKNKRRKGSFKDNKKATKTRSNLS